MADNPVSGAGTPTLPKCRDCGKRTDRILSTPKRGPNHAAIPDVRHEWLCADCEYLREHPSAPRFVKPPPARERSGYRKKRC